MKLAGILIVAFAVGMYAAHLMLVAVQASLDVMTNLGGVQ